MDTFFLILYHSKRKLKWLFFLFSKEVIFQSLIFSLYLLWKLLVSVIKNFIQSIILCYCSFIEILFLMSYKYFWNFCGYIIFWCFFNLLFTLKLSYKPENGGTGDTVVSWTAPPITPIYHYLQTSALLQQTQASYLGFLMASYLGFLVASYLGFLMASYLGFLVASYLGFLVASYLGFQNCT